MGNLFNNSMFSTNFENNEDVKLKICKDFKDKVLEVTNFITLNFSISLNKELLVIIYSFVLLNVQSLSIIPNFDDEPVKNLNKNRITMMTDSTTSGSINYIIRSS